MKIVFIVVLCQLFTIPMSRGGEPANIDDLRFVKTFMISLAAGDPKVKELVDWDAMIASAGLDMDIFRRMTAKQKDDAENQFIDGAVERFKASRFDATTSFAHIDDVSQWRSKRIVDGVKLATLGNGILFGVTLSFKAGGRKVAAIQWQREVDPGSH